MSRHSWLIEHRRFGAYLGIDEHPRTGKIAPVYRADDTRRPAALFPTMLAAQIELATISSNPAAFSITALNG